MKKAQNGVNIIVMVIGLVLLLWLILSAISPEETATVVVNIPNSENQLVIEEYKNMRSGDIYFYLRSPQHRDRRIGTGGFNEPICPIAGGHYEFVWEDGAVTVRYPFSSSAVGEKENWTEIRLDLTE